MKVMGRKGETTLTNPVPQAEQDQILAKPKKPFEASCDGYTSKHAAESAGMNVDMSQHICDVVPFRLGAGGGGVPAEPSTRAKGLGGHISHPLTETLPPTAHMTHGVGGGGGATEAASSLVGARVVGRRVEGGGGDRAAVGSASLAILAMLAIVGGGEGQQQAAHGRHEARHPPLTTAATTLGSRRGREGGREWIYDCTLYFLIRYTNIHKHSVIQICLPVPRGPW